MKKQVAAVFLVALTFLLSGCGEKTAAPETRQIFAMDTVMDLTAYGAGAKAALEQSDTALRDLEKLLSRTDAASEVSTLNTNAGTAVPVSQALYDLIGASKEYALKTDHAFDITVAPIVSAWGFTTDKYQVPAQTELDALLPMVDSSRIVTDPGSAVSGPTVTLAAGQTIDLGGIAKGYAADCVEQIFLANGVESGKIALGGNVYVRGGKPDGSAWSVGIQDPADAEALAGILNLEDAYAVTSGGYQRYFEQTGTIYHHIIDPATGYPAQSGLISVTVVAPANDFSAAADSAIPGNGTLCDAFSTALFVMGETRAVDFWRTSGYDFDLILITDDHRVVVSSGLEDRFETAPDTAYAYETIS